MHDSSDHCFTITKRDQLDQITAAAAVHAPHQLPLYCAVRDGMVNLITPERGAQIPKKMLEDARRPIVVLIGDDDYVGTGPDGWACSLRVRRWGRGALVHAAAGRAEHYEYAVGWALTVRRLVLVECGTSHKDAWGVFLAKKMPMLAIKARDGFPHPIMPNRAEKH